MDSETEADAMSQPDNRWRPALRKLNTLEEIFKRVSDHSTSNASPNGGVMNRWATRITHVGGWGKVGTGRGGVLDGCMGGKKMLNITCL